MALTLVEAAKYSNDVLATGVIELLVYDDPVLERLPFIDIVGNGHTYNVETTMSGADFYNPGDTWVESTSTVTQATAFTTILGGDADVDNFLKKTRGNLQDLMGEQIAAKTKAIKEEYKKSFYYGYRTGAGLDAKAFDGLHYLIRSTTSPYENTVALASASGTPKLLNLSKLEQAVDYVKNGKPELIVMTKMMRRYINVFLNGVGGLTKEAVQGKTVQTLCDIPVAVSDRLSNNEACDITYGSTYGHNYADGRALGDDDDATSIFILRFGPDACCGVQSLPITVEKLGSLETKDATRVRIKWYPSLMLKSIISCAKVTGVDPDGTVAA